MSAEHGHRPPDLIRGLFTQPWRFEAFQAIRVIERAVYRVRGVDAADEAWPVRFRGSTSLAFAPSDVESVQVVVGQHPIPDPDASLAALVESDARIDVVQPIMGLLGVAGALPHTYTESLLGGEGQRRRPEARAFLDLLTHRAVTLWYRAWKYRHPALQRESGRRGGIVDAMRAVAGMGLESQREMFRANGGIDDHSIAGFAAVLRHGPISAAYLAGILSTYFGHRFIVHPFVEGWYAIPEDARSRLGRTGSTLGRDSVLGERCRLRHHRIRIEIGSLREHDYRRFLPNGPDTRVLAQWILLCLGVAYEIEVMPLLRAIDVRGLSLGVRGALGRDAFLGVGAIPRDRGDASFLLPLSNTDSP